MKIPLPRDEQDGYFFGPGGIFEHADTNYPTVDQSASTWKRFIQKAHISYAGRFVVASLVDLIVFLIASTFMLSVANQASAEMATAFQATVGSDFPAKGTELYYYQLGDYPAEYIYVDYSNGTPRYFFTGEDSLDNTELPSDEILPLMAADE